MSRLLSLMSVVVLSACGVDALGPVDAQPKASPLGSSACAKLSGRYLGTLTPTAIATSDHCGGTLGVAADTGVDFASNGDFLSWVNHGDFAFTCTTAYASCAVHVSCASEDVQLTYDLTGDLTGDNAIGTYRLTGTGTYCPSFIADISVHR